MNTENYLLYTPFMGTVAGGLREPRHHCDPAAGAFVGLGCTQAVALLAPSSSTPALGAPLSSSPAP